MDEGLNMENSSNQKFFLKWNNFQSNFVSQFEALKDDGDFVDVTLYCFGKCIKAHKVVLSACSPYFKNIFKDHPGKHPIIIFDNLSYKNLEAVIQFIYTGQAYIEQDELSSFLKAAETLQIKVFSKCASDQSLIKTNIPPVHESEALIISRKSKEKVDCKIKKRRSKRIARRASSKCAKENNNELCEEQKTQEKDWCVSGNKSEGNTECATVNANNAEQTVDNDDKILTSAIGGEDYTPGELKRPHWLDSRSCPLCNRVYSTLSNLRQHMKLIHNPTLATCKLCYKTFKTDLYLRRHLISFHEVNANGNGTNMLSTEHMQCQPPDWNPFVKLESDSFKEIFNSNEIYRVPQ